jgi:type I restriction enzyme S subunit
MELVRLENICDIKSGGTPSRNEKDNYGGLIPWAKISDIEASNGNLFTTEETITEKGLKAIHNRIFDKGTLLFAMYGSVGKIAFTQVKVSTNQAILGINIKDESKLYDRYLYYWLLRKKHEFLHLANGVTQKNLSTTFVRNLEIPLPPIASQRRIANILDKADEIVRKRKEAIALTEQLLKSTFLDMFGDPVINPKGWEKCQVKDIAKVKTGKTPSRKENDNYGNSIRWVKTTEVINSIIEETEEYLSEKGALQMNVFPEKTIIVAMYGQGKTRGRTALLANPSTTNQACAAILPSYKYNTIYLWELLKLSYYRLRELGRGGNQPNLNLDMIKTFEIIFPPLENQEKFEDIITKIQIQRAKNIKSLEESENLFNSLLQKAFKGEL